MQITDIDLSHTFIILLFHHIIIGDRFANNANHLCLEISKTTTDSHYIDCSTRQSNRYDDIPYDEKSFSFLIVKITPTLSNVKCISKEILGSGVSQVRSKSSSSHRCEERYIFVIVAAPIANNEEEIYPMFSILFPRRESISSKKGRERVVRTRLNLSLTGGRGGSGKERWNDENTEGGYKIAEEVTAQAEVPIAS